MALKIQDAVKIKPGATEWMKERGYWGDYITSKTIDNMVGVIVSDYRHLHGDNAHVGIELGFSYEIGVSEEFLEKVKRKC